MIEVLLTCPVCGLETPQIGVIPPGLRTGDKLVVVVACLHCGFTGSTKQRYLQGMLAMTLFPSDFTGYQID